MRQRPPTQPSLLPDEPDTPPPPKPRRANTGDLNDLTGTEWIKATKSWFVCDSHRYHRNRDTELHPARYPEEMVAKFLEFFTKPGGWVLDPFCGSGATLVSCLETGRRGIGIELSEKYAEVARARLAPLPGSESVAVLQADAREIASPDFWPYPPESAPAEPVGQAARLSTQTCREQHGQAAPPTDYLPPRDPDGLPQFDFIMTSPPYWNMLRKSRGGVESAQKTRAKKGLDTSYSDDPGDLGNLADYETFIESLGGVFDACARLLKPGKYLVCVVQNCRTPDKEVKPLAWDLARRISQALSFQGERIWCQDSKPLGIWGFPTVFVPNYHHHYCLIFRKP